MLFVEGITGEVWNFDIVARLDVCERPSNWPDDISLCENFDVEATHSLRFDTTVSEDSYVVYLHIGSEESCNRALRNLLSISNTGRRFIEYRELVFESPSDIQFSKDDKNWHDDAGPGDMFVRVRNSDGSYTKSVSIQTLKLGEPSQTE